MSRPLRLSKKWLNATFSSFFYPVLAPMARSAPNAKYENLWVFIRSDAHVVRAGLNIRGCGPLSTPGFFDSLKKSPAGLFFCFSYSVSYFLSPLVQPWTIFVRAKRAMTLGMTMSWLNMSESSQTRSLEARVPRKMNTSAITV